MCYSALRHWQNKTIRLKGGKIIWSCSVHGHWPHYFVPVIVAQYTVVGGRCWKMLLNLWQLRSKERWSRVPTSPSRAFFQCLSFSTRPVKFRFPKAPPAGDQTFTTLSLWK